MVQIAGIYKLDKNENLLEYLKSVGISDEIAQKAERVGLTLEIIIEGNKYAFNSSSGVNLSFTLDQEFEEPLPIPGVALKSIAKTEGDNKIVLTSKAADGRTGSRSYEFTDSGFTLTLISDSITAKRYYTRA